MVPLKSDYLKSYKKAIGLFPWECGSSGLAWALYSLLSALFIVVAALGRKPKDRHRYPALQSNLDSLEKRIQS